jgi:hypothetical protein
MQTRILLLTGILTACRFVLPEDPIQKPGSIVPVQAELLTQMSVNKLQTGATVLARVTTSWHNSGCDLKSGAILEGQVLAAVPFAKPEKTSEIDLLFNKAQCSGREMGDFELILAAIAAPPETLDLGILSSPVPVDSAMSRTPQGLGNTNSIRMNGNIDLGFGKPAYQFTDSLRIGDVSGIHGLKLSPGAGPENSTALVQKGHNLRLEQHTLFVLVPMPSTSEHAQPRSSATAPSPAPAEPPPALPPAPAVADVPPTAPLPAPHPVEEAEICEPPQCNVALPSGNAINARKPETTISIDQLGYSPRPQRAMDDFDNDEALAWLGPHQLLVAFNPHTLMTRHSLGPSGSTMRVIRVALVNTKTRQVTRTLDWELPDEGEYLWPLGDGTLLVHVASELRVYGENLRVLKRVSLDGPLSFVRVSPDRKFIVIGTLHERHAPELHAFLKQALETEPEEDISMLVLNHNLETVAQSTSHTGMLPPTLLNEGQARLEALPGMRYSISLLGWDNNTSTLLHFNSSCTPEFTSFPPDLIFLVSCSKRAESLREYRVLRANGQLALKGSPNLTDCGHSASGSANNEAFVVKTVQSTVTIPPGAPFSAGDLSTEEIAVYRAADGKRLLGVRVGAPSSSRDNYALAPNGDQLAVLTRQQISVYSVPSK